MIIKKAMHLLHRKCSQIDEELCSNSVYNEYIFTEILLLL